MKNLLGMNSRLYIKRRFRKQQFFQSAYWESSFQQPIDYDFAFTLKEEPPKNTFH